MEGSKFKIIEELMHELAEEMEYGPEDFEERLGRKKPDVAVIEVKKGPGYSALEKAEEKLGVDLDEDREMGESPEHAAKVLGKSGYMDDEYEDEEPDMMLKKRLMRLRG